MMCIAFDCHLNHTIAVHRVISMVGIVADVHTHIHTNTHSPNGDQTSEYQLRKTNPDAVIILYNLLSSQTILKHNAIAVHLIMGMTL